MEGITANMTLKFAFHDFFSPIKISLPECSWKGTRERLGISPKQIHLRIQTNTSGHNFVFVTQLWRKAEQLRKGQ